MRIGLALEELHRSEHELAQQLQRVHDRHKADHEVFYLAAELARWSEDHVRLLAAAAERYDRRLDPEPWTGSTVAAKAQQAVSVATGRQPEAAMLLLADLRQVVVIGSGVSVDWELVAQAAQGVQDLDLLDLAKRCHPDTLRQVRWANAHLKASATQVLVG